MADFQLYIGYRHTSSWSLRGWLAMRKAGVPFEEIMIRYRRPDDKARLTAASPTSKVPLLVDRRAGEIKVWDSLAIGEYLAEAFPAARLWPQDREARAVARSISAEMHSGFRPLREHLAMALLERLPKPEDADADADIARVAEIWRTCRERFGDAGGGGPYLFGHFTVADAMYAPVVSRFRTYGVVLDPVGEAYMTAILADPDVEAWFEQAKKDPLPEPLPA